MTMAENRNMSRRRGKCAHLNYVLLYKRQSECVKLISWRMFLCKIDQFMYGSKEFKTYRTVYFFVKWCLSNQCIYCVKEVLSNEEYPLSLLSYWHNFPFYSRSCIFRSKPLLA